MASQPGVSSCAAGSGLGTAADEVDAYGHKDQQGPHRSRRTHKLLPVSWNTATCPALAGGKGRSDKQPLLLNVPPRPEVQPGLIDSSPSPLREPLPNGFNDPDAR